MKKIFLVLMMLSSLPFGNKLGGSFLFAQGSMTDEQVITFVTQRQKAGENQATIVNKLLQKGVTVQQIQNIRKKYTAQENMLGATDLVGTNNSTQISRLRSQKQSDNEQTQIRNNYMKKSLVRGVNGMEGYSLDERTQMMNDEIGFLDIDSLLYYKDRLKEEAQVFGRNIFSNEYLSFQPNMNMATPANYRLGTGDNVIIDVWGASQETFTGDISPDGTITIQGFGPIHIAGLSVEQANKLVQQKLGRSYSDSKIQLSVGNTRTIQVQVLGEVQVPGTYTISSLSTAFNALYMAGGISDLGTLRDIKVYRNGREISCIDVYDYILNGNVRGDVRLQDNDVINVGAYKELVRASGRVKRPMFYEMLPGESLKTLMDYCGGFAGGAYKKNVRVVRRSGNESEYSIHTIEEFDMSSFELADGDSLYVDSIIARFSNMVEVKGAVYHPGMYEVGGFISGVRDLIKVADGVKPGAFTNRAVMHRKKEDMSLEVIAVDLKGILDGTSPDVLLKNEDVLFVPSREDYYTEQTLKISGEVVYPGTYQYADNTTIEDLILQAGGLTNQASVSKVDVFRRIYDEKAMTVGNDVSETHSFTIKEGFVVDGEPGFKLAPYDEIMVRKSPSVMDMQTVHAEGCVNFSGDFAITNRNYRLSDLVNAAGGVTEYAYARGARLERVMTAEERKQREISLKTQQVAMYESNLQSDKTIDLEKADSLLNMKLDIGNTYPIAIDLEMAMQQPGSLEDIILRDGDRLVIPQYSNTVKISGEVMYPISMNFKSGKPLSYYIKRAGGYGNNARKKRVYAIYMNGSVELINKHSSKAIQPGCEIVVPSKDLKQKTSITEYMSIGTTAASLSTMMVSIANLLKK